MSEPKLGQTVCAHQVSTEHQCIECRIELTHKRLMFLFGQKTDAAKYERAMLDNDLKLYCKMLADGRTHL